MCLAGRKVLFDGYLIKKAAQELKNKAANVEVQGRIIEQALAKLTLLLQEVTE